jgi:hypothetical protein
MTFRRLSTILLFLFATAACGGGDPGPVEPESDNVADSSNADVSRADADWMTALARDDEAAAAAALDAEFEWTNNDGLTRTREQSAAALPTLAADLRSESGARHFHYGHVHVITSGRERQRMMRVWAQRPEGWRILGVITTPMATGATPFAASGPATGDCENPCRAMPFMPESENAKQIAAVFSKLKMDEWHPDPEAWAPYVLDDVYYVTETAQLSKADRVERLAKLKETGAPSVPGDPVVSMRIHDFDDSAVMIARHTPYRGGNPYYSLRVWALRDGRWQLANTQQTVIRAASR